MRLIGQVGRGLVTRPIYARDIIEQLDAIGVGSLTVVILTGTFTGMVLALQSGMTLDQFGGREVVGRLVSASMVKELGPVLTALMVTGALARASPPSSDRWLSRIRSPRSGPWRRPGAQAGDSARGRRHVMLPLLTVVSDAVGIAGGWIISTMQLRVASSVYWNNVVQGLFLDDLWMGLIKPLAFGFVLVSIGCHGRAAHDRRHTGRGPGHHASGRGRVRSACSSSISSSPSC
jgi:phospholipid/cholesterol/gamma-HCH transport system permease protein